MQKISISKHYENEPAYASFYPEGDINNKNNDEPEEIHLFGKKKQFKKIFSLTSTMITYLIMSLMLVSIVILVYTIIKKNQEIEILCLQLSFEKSKTDSYEELLDSKENRYEELNRQFKELRNSTNIILSHHIEETDSLKERIQELEKLNAINGKTIEELEKQNEEEENARVKNRDKWVKEENEIQKKKGNDMCIVF